jgi:hypothetical protein
MPFPENDDERFEALKDAITESYATGPVRARRRDGAHSKRLAWFVAGGCAVIAIFATVMIGEWRAAMQIQSIAQPEAPPLVAANTLPPYTPPPATLPPAAPLRTSRPHTPAPHTPPPHTPAPTSTPASKPTATVSPSPMPSAVAVIHNAFLLVHSNNMLKVGGKGSCGGLDVTVEVRGYPKGCTVFDADSTGPLANGRGAALVVPVSTTEAVEDVKYALLYVRSNETDAPRFVGLLRSQGSGPVVVRLEHGVIKFEESGSDTKYFTFDGHRIVRTRTVGPEDDFTD